MDCKRGKRMLAYKTDIETSQSDRDYATDHDYASDGEYGCDDLDRLMLRFYRMKECLEWEEE